MMKRNSILKETIISKETLNEFENPLDKKIDIQQPKIEFRASHTPNSNLNNLYSSKNTVLTNPKPSSPKDIFGVQVNCETDFNRISEPKGITRGFEDVSMLESFSANRNSFGGPETSQDFNTFKRKKFNNYPNNRANAFMQKKIENSDIKNIQCMFPQEYSNEDIIRSHLNNIFLEQIKEINKKLKIDTLECLTFQEKIKQKLKKEKKIQHNKLNNDIMIRVTKKIEQMENEEEYLKEKITKLKNKINNLEKDNENKTKEISDILSRMDLSMSKKTFDFCNSRKFEIKCTGKCKYRRDGSYEKNSVNFSRFDTNKCTCFDAQNVVQRESSIHSTQLEKKLSIEKNKRRKLEKEILKYKQTHSQMSIQNLKMIEENQKNKKLLLEEKQKTQEIKNKFENTIENLQKNLSYVDPLNTITSINISPEIQRSRKKDSKRQFSGNQKSRPGIKDFSGKQILSNYFLKNNFVYRK